MTGFVDARGFQLVPQIPNDNKMQNAMQQMMANRRMAEADQKKAHAQKSMEALVSLRSANPDQKGAMLKSMIELGYAPQGASNLVANPQNIDLMADILLGSRGVNVGAGKSDRFGKVTAGMKGEDPVYFQTDSAGNTRVVEGIKPITTGQKESEKTDALLDREEKLKSKQLAIQKQQMEIDRQRLDIGLNEAKKSVQDAEAMMGINIATDLIDSDLGSIYGWGEEYYPEFMRSQAGIDLSTKRNQLIAMLELGSRGKLKGQGQVSDSEQKVLSRAVTSLSNPNISTDLAKKELSAAVDSLKRTMTEESASSVGSSKDLSDEDLLNKYK